MVTIKIDPLWSNRQTERNVHKKNRVKVLKPDRALIACNFITPHNPDQSQGSVHNMWPDLTNGNAGFDEMWI